MSKTEKLNEEQVFKQEVSDDELESVAGGVSGYGDATPEDCYSSHQYCTNEHYRRIYSGWDFPMCAASVEDGSWCKTNDACYQDAIVYWGMSVCKKAWH